MAARVVVKGMATRAMVNENTYVILYTRAAAKGMEDRAAIMGSDGSAVVEEPWRPTRKQHQEMPLAFPPDMSIIQPQHSSAADELSSSRTSH
jgi:hypothetical protein